MIVPLWLSTVKLAGYQQRIINLMKVSHGKRLASSLTEKMVVRPTVRAPVNDFSGLHSLNFYHKAPKNYKTQYYRVWWVLTPTYLHLMNRSPDGKALNAINEIFRGEKAALHFMDSQSDHTTANFQSPNILVQRERVDPTHAYGLMEKGPTISYPEEIVRSMTDLHYDATQGGYSGLGAILDDDS